MTYSGVKGFMVYNQESHTESKLQTTTDVADICYSDDGKRLAYSNSGKAIVLEAESWKEITQFRVGSTSDFRLSPNGEFLVTFDSQFKTGTLWDVKTQKSLGVFAQYRDSGNRIADVAFSPDSQSIAAISGYGEMMLWDVAANKKSAILLDNVDNSGGRALAFSPDGTRIAVGTNRKLSIYNLEHRKYEYEEWLNGTKVTHVAYSADGKHLASVLDYDAVVIHKIK